ncbi:MAG: tRNA (adenosine(37)-N6)-threonylcarbamoyltransferase complex dimerization subunit type 1 TsaB [Parafilimonas sp.]
MAFILNINTAFETAVVSVSNDNEIVNELQSSTQKEHASFLEPAIKSICEISNIKLNDIDAISVINGPGSYTGLRIGLASAKALCYALNKSLILLNTLDVMAYALRLQSVLQQQHLLFCPMIDARRMEVYTALYDSDLHLKKKYSSEIIDENFLEDERKRNVIVAGGKGSLKFQEIINDKTVTYINQLSLLKPSAILSNSAFICKQFSDVAYCEPFYLKPVYFRK